MEINKIEEICGKTPINFEIVDPVSENFIFQNDPSFSPINLYDFMGNGATVNSYAECAHYVSGGWEPFKTTIFDIGLIVLYFVVGLFAIYKIYKSGKYKFLNPIFLIENIKSFINKHKNFTDKTLLQAAYDIKGEDYFNVLKKSIEESKKGATPIERALALDLSGYIDLFMSMLQPGENNQKTDALYALVTSQLSK